MNFSRHTKNIILIGIANVFMYARNIFLLPILSRTLGVSIYGLWSQLYAMIELLIPLFVLSLPAAATRFLAAETDKHVIKIGFWTSTLVALTSSLIFGLVVLFISVPAKEFFGEEMNQIVDLLWVLMMLVILSAISNSCINYFRTFERTTVFCLMMLLESFGFIIATMIFISVGWKIMAPLMALIIIKILICLWGIPKIISEIGLCSIDRETLRKYLSYAVPLIPMGVLYWTIQMSDRYLIDFYLSKEDVGRYSATYALGSLIAFIYSPIFAFFTPSVTKLWENGQFDDLRLFICKNIKYPALFSLPIVISAPMWGMPLIQLVAGKAFVTSAALLLTILLGYLALMVGTFFVSILYLTKETKKILWINVVTAALNILLNIVLIPQIGILGAGLSTFITFLLQTVIFYLYASRHFTFDFGSINLLKIWVCSFICAGIVKFFTYESFSSLIISSCLGAIVYIFLIYKSGTISRNELLFFFHFLKNDLMKKN